MKYDVKSRKYLLKNNFQYRNFAKYYSLVNFCVSLFVFCPSIFFYRESKTCPKQYNNKTWTQRSTLLTRRSTTADGTGVLCARTTGRPGPWTKRAGTTGTGEAPTASATSSRPWTWHSSRAAGFSFSQMFWLNSKINFSFSVWKVEQSIVSILIFHHGMKRKGFFY